MNLTQLRYFQTVCRHGSITSAVEELQVSQPSVSSAIRALEEEFGVPFFERQHRGMVPTEEGKQFLLLTDSLLEHAGQVEQVMREVSRQRRALRIGMTPLVGSVIMPQIYESFFREKPDIRFHIREAAQDELLAELASNRQDVIIVPHIEPLAKELHTIPVLRMKMACCLAPAHPLARRRSLRVEEVKDEKLVLFQETSVQSQAVLARYVNVDAASFVHALLIAQSKYHADIYRVSVDTLDYVTVMKTYRSLELDMDHVQPVSISVDTNAAHFVDATTKTHRESYRSGLCSVCITNIRNVQDTLAAEGIPCVLMAPSPDNYISEVRRLILSWHVKEKAKEGSVIIRIHAELSGDYYLNRKTMV